MFSNWPSGIRATKDTDTAEKIAVAVSAERERCAKICETMVSDEPSVTIKTIQNILREAAAAIRRDPQP
jgi:hypothetical protein